jgi:hypothetical protein
MPGVNLNLSLPSLSDSMSTVVTKLVQALNTVQNDLAPKIAAGIININAALPCNGNPLTSVGYVTLASGQTPTTAGSIYFNNGEFYLVDAAGAIQLTASGAINVGVVGGITGMNATTAAVTYVNGSQTFQFTSNVGVYAKIQAANVILQGTNSTVTLGVDNAVVTPLTINIKSLPAAGISQLVYNASTATLEDGAVTAATNATTFNAKWTIGGSGDYAHTFLKEAAVPFVGSGADSNVTVTGLGITTTSAAPHWQSPIHTAWGLRVGDRIKLIDIVFSTAPAGTYNFSLFKIDTSHATEGGDTLIQSFSVTNPGSGTLSQVSVTSPVAIATTERWFFTVGSAPSGAVLSFLAALYDHP